jgi:hypothetical protein
MSNGENNLRADWQKGNAEYLAATMAWLRACLEQYAAPAPGSQSSIVLQSAPEEPRSKWLRCGSWSRAHIGGIRSDAGG